MLVGHELIGFYQALKGFKNEFFAVAHVVEDLQAENEIAAIDPNLGAIGTAKLADAAPLVHVDQMIGQCGAHCEKSGNFAARPEVLQHFFQINIGETVAIVREEKLFILNLRANRPKPFPDISPKTGIDKRHTPIFFWLTKKFDLRTELRYGAVGEGVRPVVDKEFLDRVRLISKAKHEILVPVVTVILHNMPEDRLMADWDHRLWNRFGIF